MEKLLNMGVTAKDIRKRFNQCDNFFWILSCTLAIENDRCASTVHRRLLNGMITPSGFQPCQLDTDDLNTMNIGHEEIESDDYANVWDFIYDAWNNSFDPSSGYWDMHRDIEYVFNDRGYYLDYVAFKRLCFVQKALHA